jgi:hypothetical protein
MTAIGPTGWQYNLLTTGLMLAGALLLAAVVIALAGRWRRRSSGEDFNPGDQLTHFRSLYERGEISAEEFQRLRTLLTGPVAQSAGVQKAPEVPKPPGEVPPPTAGTDPPSADGIRPA